MNKKWYVLMLMALAITIVQDAKGWSVTTTTAAVANTGNPVPTFGGRVATGYSVGGYGYTSTSAKYEVFVTSASSPAAVPEWVSNLSISYWTVNSGVVGELYRGSLKTISLDKASDQINFTLSADFGENKTTKIRQFGVKITFGNNFFSLPIWFIYNQYPGVDKVEVSLLSNGGSEPKPYSTYQYVNGGSHGYAQPTRWVADSSYSGVGGYYTDYVMPYTTRDGYVFDAWYTISSTPGANNIRIDETTRTSALVKSIYANWLLAPVENVTATQGRSDMVRLSWDSSKANVAYTIYRSEVDRKPPDFLARVTTCFFEDETAKPGRTYYYWVDATDGSSVPVPGAPVVGCRAMEDVQSVGTVVVTNVVVHYILNSIRPEFSIQPSGDMNFVNIIAEVSGRSVAVPETWVTNYPNFVDKFGSDFTAALLKPTGKVGPGGAPMLVWQDYVAGTDPTKEDDVFTASITMVDGKVVISYTPELDDTRKAMRQYTTWGKKSLLDQDWTVIPEGREAEYNFFRVTVEMK